MKNLHDLVKLWINSIDDKKTNTKMKISHLSISDDSSINTIKSIYSIKMHEKTYKVKGQTEEISHIILK